MNHTSESPVRSSRKADSLELAAVVCLAAVAFLSVPWTLQRLGLGWDSLNHHLYLGWVADTGRFSRDYLAAGGQATQFPYLYWPLYRLAAAGASGMQAGAVLALLHVLAVPPVWWIARLLLPQPGVAGAALRLAAVALGFMSALPLKTLESTGNDVLAAIPVLWAVAIALHAGLTQENTRRRMRCALLAGILAGVAVSCKFSNGPLVALLPVVFLFAPGPYGMRLQFALRFAAGALVGFVTTYAHWGWQLWGSFGNPIYPFGDSLFAPVRAILGWTP